MTADKLEQLNKLLLINYWGQEEGRLEASPLPKQHLHLCPGGPGHSRAATGFPIGRPAWSMSLVPPQAPVLGLEVPQASELWVSPRLEVLTFTEPRASAQLCLAWKGR